MTSRRNDVRVGATVLLAATIVIVGILWLKNFQIAAKSKTLIVMFPEVGGLQGGDVVQVNGVESGHVGTIGLAGDSVQAVLILEEDAIVGRDAMITIRERGMMGEKFVLIRTQDHAHPLPDRAHVAGRFDAGLAEVMAMSGKTLQDLEGLTSQIHHMLHTGAEGRDLENMVHDMASLTTTLRRATDENRDDMRAAVKSMRSGASQMDVLLRKHGGDMGTALTTATAAAQHMDSLTTQLRDLSASLQAVATEISQGKGMIGQMVYDDSMYTVLSTTVTNASTLVTDMLKHPKKYFRFSLF